LQANLAAMHALQNQIDKVEAELTRYFRTESGFRLTQEYGGHRYVLATVILLEAGEIECFVGAGNYFSYRRSVRQRTLT